MDVFLTYSHQVVKSKSYQIMNKTEKGVTINEQNKAEKTNAICTLINTSVLIIFFFKGVGAGFVVNGKSYMTFQKYVVIAVFTYQIVSHSYIDYFPNSNNLK